MTSIIKVDQIQKADGSAFAFGKVLQVVQELHKAPTSINTSTFVSTPIEAVITPTSISSKILVRVSVTVGAYGSNEGFKGSLYRNGSQITDALGDAAGSRSRAWFHVGDMPLYSQFTGGSEYLDSPATTSATTYTLYGRGVSGYPFYINTTEGDTDYDATARTMSVITLMEIAG